MKEHYRILSYKTLDLKKNLEITQSNQVTFKFEKWKTKKATWCIKDLHLLNVSKTSIRTLIFYWKAHLYLLMIMQLFGFRILPQQSVIPFQKCKIPIALGEYKCEISGNSK